MKAQNRCKFPCSLGFSIYKQGNIARKYLFKETASETVEFLY